MTFEVRAKKGYLLFAAGAALFCMLPLKYVAGQAPSPLVKIPTGVVGAHLSGRLVGGPGLSGHYQLLCYLTFLQGVGTGVFAGAPGEQTAQFSTRSDPFQFQTIVNGSLLQFSRLAVPGVPPPAMRVYYSANPNRDFSQPDSFSEGQQIAVFRSLGLQGGT